MTSVPPPDPMPVGWRRRLGLFADTPFAVYWLGGLLSNAGTWLQTVAASVYVYQLTGSIASVGLLNFVSFLPIVLFSVYGGSLADRRDRRWIAIGTSVVAAGLAFTLGIVTLTGHAGVAAVIAVGFGLNTVYAITKPSITSLLPELVPRQRIDEAVSLNTLQFILGQLLGPLLATIVLATLGAAQAFLINGVTFIGPILAMAYLLRVGLGGRVRTEAPTTTGRTNPLPATPVKAIEVFGYIRNHLWIGYMLVTVICTSAAMEVARTTAPALAVEQLGIGESGAGIIVAAQSLGSAIGVLTYVSLRARGPSVGVATAGLLIQASGLVVLAASGTLALASIGVGLVGVGFSLAFPVPTGALQKEVDPAFRGRVMAVHQIAHLGNRPFSALAIGVVAASFGTAFAAIAAVAVIPLGIGLLRRGWRGRPADSSVVQPLKA